MSVKLPKLIDTYMGGVDLGGQVFLAWLLGHPQGIVSSDISSKQRIG
jgi:hypothetical protein